MVHPEPLRQQHCGRQEGEGRQVEAAGLIQGFDLAVVLSSPRRVQAATLKCRAVDVPARWEVRL